MTPSIRPDLVGVWRRESLAVSGGTPFEDSVVYWLHAGEYFADMRWPVDRSGQQKPSDSAFAGTAHWSKPQIRFSHEIDFTKEYLEDAADLFFLDGKIIERGQITVDGEVIDFEEVWKLCDSQNISSRVEVARLKSKASSESEAQTGYFVRVKNYAIAMIEVGTEFSAACWSQKNRGTQWNLLNSIGEAEKLRPSLDGHISETLPSEWEILMQGSMADELSMA